MNANGCQQDGCKIDAVHNDTVPAFLRAIQHKDQKRIHVTELQSKKDIVDYVAGPIRVHTAFVARVIVAPGKRKTATTICHPSVRVKSQRRKNEQQDQKKGPNEKHTHQSTSEASSQNADVAKDDKNENPAVAANDSNYLTYIVILPHIGVFYSDFGYVQTGNTTAIVPLPVSWLGMQHQPEERVRRYIKRFVEGDGGIFRVDVCLAKSATPLPLDNTRMQDMNNTQPTVLSIPPNSVPRHPHIIHGVQLHDTHPSAPLIPPNLFCNDRTTVLTKKAAPEKALPISNATITTLSNHRPTDDIEYRRRRYREEFSKSTTRYRHPRRYVRGSCHTHTNQAHTIVLDQQEIGDFDIRICC